MHPITNIKIVWSKSVTIQFSRPYSFSLLLALALAGCAQPGVPVTGGNSNAPDAAYAQSETASTVAVSNGRNRILVTYNDETNSSDTILYTAATRKILKGTSLMGWSYSEDQGKTWTYGGRVSPPPSWSVLWGDPAVTVSSGDPRYVFLSNVAIPDSKMPAEGINGSVIITGADSYIGGACISRSSDGGRTFGSYQCVSNTAKNDVPNSEKGHFYDGGSMASSPAGEIYAAYVDVTTNQIDVWRSKNENATFELLPPPFPNIDIATHPRIRVNPADHALYVIAQAAQTPTTGPVYINRYLNGQWGSPVQASQPAVIYPDVTFGPGLELRTGPQFSFAIGAASNSSGSDAIRILVTRRDEQSGRYYVGGSFCPLSLSPGCWGAPEWGTTPGNLNSPGDQFNPNVEAWPGSPNISPAWKATYYDRDGSTANTVNVQQGNLAYLPDGKRIFVPFDLIVKMPVCSDNRGYWGDYDNLLHVGFQKGTNAPQFMRTLSDSSLGCDRRWQYTSHHLHVRSVIFPPNPDDKGAGAELNACGGTSTLQEPVGGGCTELGTGKCGRWKCVGTDSVTCDTTRGLENACGGCNLMGVPGSGHGRGDRCICNNAAQEEGILVCARDKNHLLCCPCGAAAGCGPGSP